MYKVIFIGDIESPFITHTIHVPCMVYLPTFVINFTIKNNQM